MGLDAKTYWLIDRQSQCDFDFDRVHSHVETGSSTSTVTLRVVRGDEKESLESEAVKYGRESQGIGTREWLRWRSPAEIVNDKRSLVRERARNQQSSNGLTVIKIWS
jgi:hypothetical protein